MDVVSLELAFEWDEGNQEKNKIKHQVLPSEAEEMFQNMPLLVNEDEKHSIKEKRYQALGKTDRGRLLFASFTLRGKALRVISVRNMSRKEKNIYEKA